MNAPAVPLVRWQPLSTLRRAAARALQASAKQASFAGTTARSVAACEAGDPDMVADLAVQSGDDIVGWLLLKRDAVAREWATPGAAVVGGLRIDQRHPASPRL